MDAAMHPGSGSGDHGQQQSRSKVSTYLEASACGSPMGPVVSVVGAQVGPVVSVVGHKWDLLCPWWGISGTCCVRGGGTGTSGTCCLRGWA